MFGEQVRTVLARKLELLASVHYLVDRNQVPDRSARTITKKLRACNKLFREDEVDKALRELRDHGILS